MNVGYINPNVRAMYGIPYSQLTPEQRRILHEDSVRRAKLIEEIQKEVIENNRKAFDDEARMERVLAQIYKSTQQEILASVTETLAKVRRDGGTWSYANQSALTRSRGLFEQITRELTNLGIKEQITFTQGLSGIYTDQFLRTVYTLGQSVPVKANFNRLNPVLVKKTLDYPWSGAMFSDRLWTDKEQLGRNLRVGLTQSMILGESIPQITDRINKGIDTSRYNAERVARTETKRVTYCAHKDAYEDSGVKELEYRCANGGDARTCPICKADQGKHYVEGSEPTLPRHPNCRCVYIPVVSDTFGDNELNELTGSVRGAENYEKWREAQEAKISPEAEALKDPDKNDKDSVIDPNLVDPKGEVYTGELGREIRKSFDGNNITGYTPRWGDYEEKQLEQLKAQRDLLTDPKTIKQIDSIIKNHEEYRDAISQDGVLVEVSKRGTFKLKVPPSESVEDRIRNSEYYNRYSLVEISYPKYNFDVYEERLGGKYYITTTGVSAKERKEIIQIADSVFLQNTRAVGAKLKVDTLACNKQSTKNTVCCGFYTPSAHRLTVRNFKSYADIYGTDLQGGKNHFAGTLAHEFAHIVHSTDSRLSLVTATEAQWEAWKNLIEPYYQQYRVNKLVDVGAQWRRMRYPINAEDYYRGSDKEHYYQEMWAECTAIVQEDVPEDVKKAELENLRKYFPLVEEFIRNFYAGGM